MSEAIWKRVYRCAQELTQHGMTPFTRGDLIRCVQRHDPDCGPDSINPIIQGLTDNLRGGAPGAVGKSLLHSVGRGQFVLKKSIGPNSANNQAPTVSDRQASRMMAASRREIAQRSPARIDQGSLNIGGYTFRFVCNIEPERDADGTVRKLTPQDRYDNSAGLRLNKYGNGPFCKFKIPWTIRSSGVYAFVANDQVQYVGECENLSSRFNMGYGNISPRNCFVGGQETNCRINSLVLETVSAGLNVALRFYETDDYKKVESNLRKLGAFEWNRG